nr:ribonuclease H-like domain-containing protein [Tanacetum cinerariifolium]
MHRDWLLHDSKAGEILTRASSWHVAAILLDIEAWKIRDGCSKITTVDVAESLAPYNIYIAFNHCLVDMFQKNQYGDQLLRRPFLKERTGVDSSFRDWLHNRSKPHNRDPPSPAQLQLPLPAHQNIPLTPLNFNPPNPNSNTNPVNEPPRTHPMITRSLTIADYNFLHNEFNMTDLGVLNYFLESKLGPKGVPVQDPTLYRSLAGGIQYLIFTRLDLSYAIQQICLYKHDPRKPHFAALKRILRYVQGTMDFGLQLYVFATTSLVGYTDADWTGCPSIHRSTFGYCVFLGDNLFSWSTKLHHTISRSSAEAEYRSVANVVSETTWLQNLLRELYSPLSTATLVYCDNVSAVYMSANPVQHQRMKHIEIDIHLVRDMVTAGHVRVFHVPSRYQYADIFTKGLPSALFEDFGSSLSVYPPPAQTTRAY